jgi:hypothetical protein
MLVSQSPSQALPKTKPSSECRASSWRGKVGARTECGREQDHFEPATVQEPDRRRGTPTHKQAREQASAGHSTFLIPAAFDHHFSLFPQSLFPGGLPRRSRGPSVRSISDPVVEATLNFFQSFELSLFSHRVRSRRRVAHVCELLVLPITSRADHRELKPRGPLVLAFRLRSIAWNLGMNPINFDIVAPLLDTLPS